MMQPVDQAWGVFFRNGMQPGGRWYLWPHTVSTTRAQAIEKCLANCLPYDMQDWRRLRRQGLVAARRFTAYANLPETGGGE